MADKPDGAENRYAMSLLRGGARGQVQKRKGGRTAQSKVPNAESLEAIRQAQTGEGLVGPFHSFEDLWADLNADD